MREFHSRLASRNGPGHQSPGAVSETLGSARTAEQPPETPEGLIAGIATSGDRGAFARLFQRFAPRLKTYLMRLGVSDGAAEDLAQETLLSVWRKASQFDPERATAAGWIFAIARNLRIDSLRRERGGRDERVDEPPDEPPTPEQQLKAQEGGRKLREAMRSLSEEQAAVLHLSYFEEMSHPQIARRLGMPLGTVKSRIRRASSRLRESLDDLA